MPTSDISPEIETVLGSIGAASNTKVLLLGNSGVGKSMLLNFMLSDDAFESKFSSHAVTKGTDADVLEVPPNAYLLYNVPGLLDADAKVAQQNGVEIARAIRDRGHMPVVTLFVLTAEGGRLRSEDIEAWKAITNFAPDINRYTAVSFLVNKIDMSEFTTDEDRNNYESDIRLQIHKFCGSNFSVVLLPRLSKDEKVSGARAREVVRLMLIAELTRLRGESVRVAEGARIVLHSAMLKAQIHELSKALEEMRITEADREKERAAAKAEAEAKHAAMERLHSEEMAALRAAQAKSDEAHSNALHKMEADMAKIRSETADREAQHKAEMQTAMSRPQTQMPPSFGGMDLFNLFNHGMGGGGGGGGGFQQPFFDQSPRPVHRSHPRVSAPRHARRSASPAPVLSWNQFRTAHKGQGLSIAEMAKGYHAQRKRA